MSGRAPFRLAPLLFLAACVPYDRPVYSSGPYVLRPDAAYVAPAYPAGAYPAGAYPAPAYPAGAYAAPGYDAPASAVPPPALPAPVAAGPLDEGGPDAAAALPGGLAGQSPADGLPSSPVEPVAPTAARGGPAPDAVTDLLLTPLPQRDAAQAAPPAAGSPPAQTPFMGFRPMRGQATP